MPVETDGFGTFTLWNVSLLVILGDFTQGITSQYKIKQNVERIDLHIHKDPLGIQLAISNESLVTSSNHIPGQKTQ